MKVPNLVLAGIAAAVAGGTYVVFESGGWSSGAMRDPVSTSDAGRHPVVLAPPADQPVAATRDKIAVAEPARASATQTEVAALRQELGDLRAAVAELRRQSRRAPEAKHGVEDTVPERPRYDAAARAQEERQRLEQMDVQESGFRKEPADAAWAARTSSQVQSVLDGFAVAPSGVRDLECRAATCRVELAGDALITQDGDEQVPLDKGLPLLALQLAGSLPSMSAFQVADGNGGTNTVMYFSSRNTDAPPPSGR